MLEVDQGWELLSKNNEIMTGEGERIRNEDERNVYTNKKYCLYACLHPPPPRAKKRM